MANFPPRKSRRRQVRGCKSFDRTCKKGGSDTYYQKMKELRLDKKAPTRKEMLEAAGFTVITPDTEFYSDGVSVPPVVWTEEATQQRRMPPLTPEDG